MVEDYLEFFDCFSQVTTQKWVSCKNCFITSYNQLSFVCISILIHINFYILFLALDPANIKDCVRHVSDRNIDIVSCQDRNCPQEDCGGKRYHCPLCDKSDFMQKFPYMVKKHIGKIHWNKAVRHDGELNSVFL